MSAQDFDDRNTVVTDQYAHRDVNRTSYTSTNQNTEQGKLVLSRHLKNPRIKPTVGL